VNSVGHRFGIVTSLLDVGGSTTWLCDLAGELVHRGFPVQVFSLTENHPLATEYERRGINVVVQCDRRLIIEDRLQATLEGLRDFGPTVVVGWTGSPAYETLRYVPLGVARIGVLHSDFSRVYSAAKPYEPFMDMILVLSKQMLRTALSTFQCDPNKIRLIKLGVDVQGSADKREASDTRPLRILYLGRVQQEQKRVLCFPEIYRHLQESGMPLEWTIAGEGTARAKLEKLMVSTNPMQVVRVIGNVSYSDVPALMRQHDVFLLASDYEGLSHTLLEAMGHGLVPVVSDLASGMRDVVDDTTGILVDMNDIAGYARAIKWLSDHTLRKSVYAGITRSRR
jgi:glycosyltransferase involved in cell wall biosynthesis